MSRKYIFLTIIAMVVLMSLLVGCSSTPAETTPTPDTSIVWSDDFEDGDTEGWEGYFDTTEDDYSVSEGVLSFANKQGSIRHPSTVAIGTWSFDLFLQESFLGQTHDVTFLNIPMEMGLWIEIYNMPNTQVWAYSYNESQNQDTDVFLDLGERISGWHHFDITREENGVVKVYMDGDFVIEYSDDYPYESEYFYFETWCEGPALDNVVVRNQVIDIQPPSE